MIPLQYWYREGRGEVEDGDKGISCRQDAVAHVDNKPKWLRGRESHPPSFNILNILQPEQIQNTIIFLEKGSLMSFIIKKELVIDETQHRPQPIILSRASSRYIQGTALRVEKGNQNKKYKDAKKRKSKQKAKDFCLSLDTVLVSKPKIVAVLIETRVQASQFGE
jgi:hypothetical protein